MADSPPATIMTTVLGLGLALLCAAGTVAQNCNCQSGTQATAAARPEHVLGKKLLHTRNAFLTAARSYQGFAHGGSEVEGKREIAAFFANFAHETGHLCYINEINGASMDDTKSTQWPCAYRGRSTTGVGRCSCRETTTTGRQGRRSGSTGWATRTRVSSPPTTIRAINGAVECNGKNTAEMEDRVRLFKEYCQQLGVDPGGNLTC
ncbi:hypothetical protein QOZ80_4BG0343610 [Eleusine coracana subsp. coracana]|nr:hypothetical protein QOZ80_4BG0343610 [Eleusine coracana subsp. coracana]